MPRSEKRMTNYKILKATKTQILKAIAARLILGSFVFRGYHSRVIIAKGPRTAKKKKETVLREAKLKDSLDM